MRALVDTGAEVSIIWRGVIPEYFLQKDSHPLTLRGANETKLKGGNLCIRGTCTMKGKARVGQQPVKIQCALHMYEADISVQAILSYKWLADQNFIVSPRRHVLYFQYENFEVFVSGLQGEDKRPSARLDKVVAIRLQEVPIGLIPSDPSIQYPHFQRPGKEKNALPIQYRHPNREATSEKPLLTRNPSTEDLLEENYGPCNIQYVNNPGTSFFQATITSHFVTRVTHPFVITGRK